MIFYVYVYRSCEKYVSVLLELGGLPKLIWAGA